MLCLGSSLRVTPACNMAEATWKKGGKLVIVNLQKTPYSPMALHIHAKIDDVMVLLMKKLSIEIPKFQLRRYIKFDLVKKGDKEMLSLQSIDKSGSPYQMLKTASIEGQVKTKDVPMKEGGDGFNIKCGFFAHHGESDFKFKVPKTAFKGTSCRAEMTYCPFSRKWVGVNFY